MPLDRPNPATRALLLTLAIMLALTLGTLRASAEPFNLPAKTLGGTQFWADTYLHAGWRIQKNVLTGHYRLLDAENVRRAWGSLEKCRSTFDDLRKRQGLKPASSHIVLLVHGIARASGTFTDLQAALRDAGYDATAISYPSTRDSIEAHATGLERLLDTLEGSDTVSFVTHSMGGLVIRHLLARDGAWKQRLKVHRIVQIAPPNQGSAIARQLAEFGAYRFVFGAAGQQLTPEQAARIPALPGEFAIIAGGKGDGRGFNPVLPGDDDGTVAVSETHLDGAADTLIVRETHRHISNNPKTITAVIHFLKFGSLTK